MPRVTESFAFSGGRVDRSGPYPVVRGVLICGLKSKWGYDYPGEVFTDEAVKAYENAPSYLGHGRKGEVRDPTTRFGWWENPRRRADGRPEGDYAVNPKHPYAEAFLWAAEHKPDLYRMSHVADVDFNDGRTTVRKINAVESVDVVDDGGTTNSIYESAPAGGRAVGLKVKEYADRLAPKCSVEQLLRLRWVKEEFGDLDMPPDAPAPDASGTEGEDGVSAAFKAAMLKEIDDCMAAASDPEAVKKCLGRLKKILTTHGELSADDVDDLEDDEDDEDDEPGTQAAESAPGKGKGKGKKKPGKPSRTAAEAAPDPREVYRECVAEGFNPSATQLDMLCAQADRAKRAAFIKEQKGLSAATQPRSAGRTATVRESAGGVGDKPAESARDVMARLAREARGEPAGKK